MIRGFIHALAALLLLAAPLAQAADVKPLVNASGSIRSVHTGETVGVANGGTGATTFAAHCVILGNGTTAPNVACPGTSGEVLTSNGASADPTFQAAGAGSPGGTSGQIQYNNAGAFGGFTASGDLTIDTATGVTAIGSNKVTLGMVAQSGANTMLGNWSGSTANVAANSMPSCADTAGNHLNYLAGTGIVCGSTSSTSGGGSTTLIGTGGTFYVNASTGSDSNNCTSSGSPCLTINHAISLVPPLITGSYTINVADGTYAECPKTTNIASVIINTAQLSIIGNTTTPTNVVITGSCSIVTGIGTETASIQLNASVPTLLSGIKTAPASTLNYGIFVGQSQGATLTTLTVTNATNAVAAFYSTLIFGGTTNLNGWTNMGVFLGLNSVMQTATATGVTINLTPATQGQACIHTEIGAHVDLEGPANSVVCPGGSNKVIHMVEADLHSGIWSAVAWTSVNSTTPAGSAVMAVTRASNVFLDATSSSITATNFTNSCFGWEAAAGDFAGGNRTFTSVGATSTGLSGSCLLF